MNGKVDLHTHTTHSDGANTPRELIQKVKNAGIDVLSITDHDNINGVKEAVKIGKELGVEIIPGVEISSEIGNREIHILGYFFDTENQELEHYLNFFREERIKRAGRIVNKLRNLGFNITLEDVLNKAKNSAVGRPHIAQVMLEKGIVSSYFEAFNKFIGNGSPAHEKKVHLSPQSAFRIISDASGLSFIAHPGNLQESVLKDLIESGVDGIEVIHPSHSAQQQRFYKGVVNSYFLLESGGSDYHGGKREDDSNLGQYYTNSSIIDAMRKRLLKFSA
ncbi:MAG: phosphatase [Ignavibacteria bacterium GWA2_35_9]|nr:MAG: phosphatase [Ignavibacteria bacterium GWA2_35_9]OGU45638.1 MAG: phosphatase [Ignavibacteria bacterium GWB2_36_8]OGU51929.1 MAG: phosphatase [Ignavibacteria bacterium GWC2_36_12]OGV27227.1 MAG: phosphatase [Ignavibacteria bacterium RIFOXYA2_FULL_37_17]